MSPFDGVFLLILAIGVLRITRRIKPRKLMQIGIGQQIDPEMVYRIKMTTIKWNKTEDEVRRIDAYVLFLTNGSPMGVPVADLTVQGKLFVGHVEGKFPLHFGEVEIE